ncbi:hypothetical protein BN2537_2235 [Streptomyces venezuelae]|nr:hypothetical protein BN2537_2235 [Streptomyces venezuelae]
MAGTHDHAFRPAGASGLDHVGDGASALPAVDRLGLLPVGTQHAGEFRSSTER